MTGILGLAGRGLHGLFQCDSRPQSGQRAGQTSLDQVRLLVEVDVELVEADGDLQWNISSNELTVQGIKGYAVFLLKESGI